MGNALKASIDFETRSACSLRKSGAWRYAEDPTTEILCMAYRLPYWADGRTELWTPGFQELGIPPGENFDSLLELFEWIEGGGLVEAHNAWFERSIWTNIATPLFSFPSISSNQWRCSAAKAAAHALPRGLEDALAALRLGLSKDTEGGKVMMKMTKPRKPRKAEREAWAAAHGTEPHKLLYWEDHELIARLFQYCRADILAEEALSAALPDLDEQETAIYLLDQTINQRGFQLDMGAVGTALKLIAGEQKLINNELLTLTGGKVAKATQRAQMIEWFCSEGLEIPDTRKETVRDYLSPEYATFHTITPEAKRGLELLQSMARSSTAKFKAMQSWASGDGRVRGGLVYHGAKTGRWSGAGIQPQNFPKGTVKGFKVDEAWTLLKTRNRTKIVAQYGDVLEALSAGLRGAITATPGKRLFVADYASIEARVLLWLADDQDALEVFRQGKDIYLEMASEIYGYECNKVDHGSERALGKVAILGLGYQMGWSKFTATCESWGIPITDELAQTVVNAYRAKFWRVKEMWNAQEAAAIEAIRSKGDDHPCGQVLWFVKGRFLYCELPSGRRLAYPDSKIEMRPTPWGEKKETVTFKGVEPVIRKWLRQHTYGGSIVENITQAVSRDLLAEAMQRCEASGIYMPVLSVHDEIVTEANESVTDVAAFTQLMVELPAWADGCPVEAESWCGFRYKK